MSKPDDVPEWAWDIAIAIETGYEGGEAGRRPQFIARALVAAERRGIERAAKLHDDEADRFDAAAVEEMSVASKINLDGNAVFHRHFAKAIRQLGASE